MYSEIKFFFGNCFLQKQLLEFSVTPPPSNKAKSQNKKKEGINPPSQKKEKSKKIYKNMFFRVHLIKSNFEEKF